ncbi:hypothetical protein GCM10027062_12650 [Nocardioides hungaricus]
MPHRWDPIAPSVTGLVPPVRAGGSGPTPKQARGPGWRRTSPGLYVPAHVSDTLVEQRIVEATARGGVVTGWAALRLRGGGFFDGLARDGSTRLPVPIAACDSRTRGDSGIAVIEDRIPPDDITVVHGIRCATAARALFDEMRRIGEVREMAVAIGAACAARLTTVRTMRTYVATRRWYRDVRMCREAVEMAVEGCRSPQEDRFRLIWEYDAGWGRPLINRAVYDLRGRLVAVPDLLDVERGVVGEYAGADHRDIDRHADDIAREAALRDVGLEYVEVVGRDLRSRERVIRRMERAAARAVHLERRWRIVETPEMAPQPAD